MANPGLNNRVITDFSGGMITDYNYTKYSSNQVFRILNGNLNKEGSIEQRLGREKLYNLPLAGNAPTTELFPFGDPLTDADLLFQKNNTTLYESASGAPAVVRSGLDASARLAGVGYYGFMFFCNGVNRPFMSDGTALGTYQVGIDAITAGEFAGFSVNDIAGGDATDGTHRTTFRYRSSITGARSNPYSLNQVIQSQTVTMGAGNNTYEFTIGAAAVSADTQVDVIQFFAQLAGAGEDDPYYFVGESANAAGVYTFGAGVADDDLVQQEMIDIDDNVMPTEARDVELWRGRLLAITGDYTFRYSKIRIDNNSILQIPTSWPATNELPIGFGDGDILQKIIIYEDFVFLFKQRSIWLLSGNFDSGDFEFKRLQTNYTNVGILNPRCVAQGGGSCYFLTDDLKFFGFTKGNFDAENLMLKMPPLSDGVQSLFNTFVAAHRDRVFLVNNTFSTYTQIWIPFTDTSGLVATGNFQMLVYDYKSGNANGAWTIYSEIEAASAALVKNRDGNYYMYTGDYYGLVWINGKDDVFGDGSTINGVSTGLNTPNTFNDTTQVFTDVLIGTLLQIIDGTGAGQLTRVTAINSPTQLGVSPAFITTPDNTSLYTIGGINFQVWARHDWMDDSAPPTYDKLGWYLDLDISTLSTSVYLNLNDIRYDLQFVVNRGGVYQEIEGQLTPGGISIWGAAPGQAVWDESNWSEAQPEFLQVGMNILFKTLQHRLIIQQAGLHNIISSWTYTFQSLDSVRRN